MEVHTTTAGSAKNYPEERPISLKEYVTSDPLRVRGLRDKSGPDENGAFRDIVLIKNVFGFLESQQETRFRELTTI